MTDHKSFNGFTPHVVPTPRARISPPDEDVHYTVFSQNNYRKIEQVKRHLSTDQRHAVDVVSQVLPFKTNNYVVDQLINWDDPEDPLFILNFPQREMLIPEHFAQMEAALRTEDRKVMRSTADSIRWQLNPHPAGQVELNVPSLADGTRLPGIQHKYEHIALFFASQGQTCHAYCSFCFRWPQFVGLGDLKFAMKEVDLLVRYLREHPELTDVLMTGGDPMIMREKHLRTYIQGILDAKLDHINTIRIGTKFLAYWPYRVLTDSDAEETLALLRKVVDSGKHLAIMAHFNHPRELETEAVQRAIEKLRSIGAEIRTQSPILRHINDSVDDWAKMWQKQIDLGLVPYFMFATRDTGAQHYFGVPLARGWKIFRKAMHRVSGIARTVRGYSMSALPGKIQVVGTAKIKGEKVFVLRMIQARLQNEWAHKPFFAKYDKKAVWIDDLVPAFGEKEFFYEKELRALMEKSSKPTPPSPEEEMVELPVAS